MATIFDLSDIAQRHGQPPTVWRDQLLPATFRGQQFHCESVSRENGTHVVLHEFPKRDIPYAEPMGRRAYEFTIRGYCIAYPFNTGQPLYQRDYRTPRNNLMQVLDEGQPGILQLPTLPPLYVMCTRYRWTEEERFGGYATFDMSFVEYGIKPVYQGISSFQQVVANAETLKARVQAVLAQGPVKSPPPPYQPSGVVIPPQVPPPPFQTPVFTPPG